MIPSLEGKSPAQGHPSSSPRPGRDCWALLPGTLFSYPCPRHLCRGDLAAPAPSCSSPPPSPLRARPPRQQGGQGEGGQGEEERQGRGGGGARGGGEAGPPQLRPSALSRPLGSPRPLGWQDCGSLAQKIRPGDHFYSRISSSCYGGSSFTMPRSRRVWVPEPPRRPLQCKRCSAAVR